MSGIPNNRLSFSSLNAFGGYGGCQLAWYYDRIEKLPRKPKGMPLLAGLTWDRSCTVGAEHKIATHEDPDPDQLGEVFLQTWKAEQEQDEYETPSEASTVLDRGIKAAKSFASEAMPTIEPLETQHRIEIGFAEVDWTLVGYVDLIEVATGDAVLVTDNKATASSSTKYDEAKAANDLQLGLYDVGLTSEGTKVAGRGFRSARLLKTKHELGSAFVTSSDEQRQTTLDLLGMLSGQVEDACTTGVFLPTAYLNGSWKCSSKFCDFYDRCPYGAKARVSTSIPRALETAA